MNNHIHQEHRSISVILSRGLSCAIAVLVVLVLAAAITEPTPVNTLLKTDVIAFEPGSYTLHEATDEPLVLDTDYPYDDCPPIELSLHLPSEEEGLTHIMFSHSQAWAQAWLDEELIYSFYPLDDDDQIEKKPASVFHLIELPNDWGGKMLSIKIVSTLAVTATNYPTIYLGDRGSLIMEAFLFAFPNAMACAIIALFAVALFVVSIVTFSHVEFLKQIRRFSVMLLNICVWVFLESRIRQFLFANYQLSLDITYITYFLVPVSVSNFFQTYELFQKERIFHILNWAAKVQFIIYGIASLFGVRPVKILFLMQGVSLLLLLELFIVICRAMKSHNLSSDLKILCRSLSWLGLGGVAELARFLLVSRIQSGLFLLAGLFAFSFQYVCLSVNHLMEVSIADAREREALQHALDDEKNRMMMAQMNPHFLYNALTSIQTIVKIDPDYAYNLIYDFSTHLRGTIKSVSSSEPIPFQQELANVNAYLNIERMRFGPRLKVDLDIQCDTFSVVPLTIQPLVENASKHGIFPRGEQGGTITIRSYEESDSYVIQVLDDGVGFDVDRVLHPTEQRDSVGIASLNYRLKKMMGADVRFESKPGEGTTVTVWIPK